MNSRDRRRAARIQVCIPTTVEVLGDLSGKPAAAPGYERVAIPDELRGARFEAIIWDLSINGARLGATTVPPLLSRLLFTFALAEYGATVAVGIVMWRRTSPARETERVEEGGALQPGFGVLFEAIDPHARLAISQWIQRTGEGG
jgi:hypothetical protein